jgi:lipopolysaccharide transport system ATP-binding protein
MSSEQLSVNLDSVSKAYHIYRNPGDRLKQFLTPITARLIRQSRHCYYNEFWALRDISMTIRQGETLGLIGRNGSGKSTLLQVVCGIVTPTAGSVWTKGRIAALLELGSGFNPEFTGRENVRLNASIIGLADGEIDDRFDRILAFADIGDFIDQPVKTYSSGMYVRLAFSVIVNVDPDILVVDEALAVGDARFQAKCMHRIEAMRQAGTTILFVSHDVSSVRRICDRAAWLDGGKLRAIGDVIQVTGDYTEALFSDGAGGYPGAIAPREAMANGAINGVTTDPPVPLEGGYDAQPVTHWGSHLGAISIAGVYTTDGRRIDLVSVGDQIAICIRFRAPPGADMGHLGVAFSIKDLKGADLIVSTTYDNQEQRFRDGADEYTVRFLFRNPLTTGHYLLVAAIEDRRSPQIHYYEYLEGAHYFQSYSRTDLFGMFHPDIQQIVEVGA